VAQNHGEFTFPQCGVTDPQFAQACIGAGEKTGQVARSPLVKFVATTAEGNVEVNERGKDESSKERRVIVIDDNAQSLYDWTSEELYELLSRLPKLTYLHLNVGCARGDTLDAGPVTLPVLEGQKKEPCESVSRELERVRSHRQTTE
jgi:hypothetical protein